MKISGIDKDFVNIVNYLDKNGFKPFASCDGVLENHSDPSSVTSAYISFLKSPQIIKLMAAFLRDKETFKVTIGNNSNIEPRFLYDNLITGNEYSVHFSNKMGQASSYFEKIIIGIIEQNINITGDEIRNLNMLNNILEDDKDSDLQISVTFNTQYQPYMNKTGKINLLEITTKDGCGYAKDMNRLGDIISEKYGIIRKTYDMQEKFPENEFVANLDKSICEIYFVDKHIEQIINLINDIKQIGNTLPTYEVKDIDYENINYLDDDDEPNY